MAAEPIGTGRCAVGCGSTKARYSVSKSQLAVCTCNACHMQAFARGDESDRLFRANIIAPSAAPAEPVQPAPAAEPVDQAPAPAKKRTGWGMLGSLGA